MAWMANVPSRRIDWKTERGRIDLAAVATGLLGRPPGRRGYRGPLLWWHCPLHHDHNPSFTVTPGKPWWRCFGCGAHGDAATLVMKMMGMTFREALAYLTGGPGLTVRMASRPKLTYPPETPPAHQWMTAEAAVAIVNEAAARLWSPEGESHLAYLTGPRGLTRETIRAARLGWTPPLDLPLRPRGIVIPWFTGQVLTKVIIRRPEGYDPKYVETYRDRNRHAGIYPGPEAIRPGRPLLATEGEFDTLLLGQEIGDLASVVTLGSASNHPRPDILSRMLAAAPWYVGTDRDEAGDKAAAWWPRSTRRIRPPVPAKDWTEAKGGITESCG
jgi:DNA primase